MIKIAQVVAQEFQIDLDRVKISATNTGKVPNTSATAASSGTDMNGMAARAASRKIKKRLLKFASKKFDVAASEIKFVDNHVRQVRRDQLLQNWLNRHGWAVSPCLPPASTAHPRFTMIRKHPAAGHSCILPTGQRFPRWKLTA